MTAHVADAATCSFSCAAFISRGAAACSAGSLPPRPAGVGAIPTGEAVGPPKSKPRQENMLGGAGGGWGAR